MSSKHAPAADQPAAVTALPTRRRPMSLVQRLQVGFAAASVLLLAGSAVVLHDALEIAFDEEDDRVLNGQAEALLDQFAEGHRSVGSLPGSPEWRMLDERGQAVAQSVGWSGVPNLPWPKAGDVPHELQSRDGRTYSVLVAERAGTNGRRKIQIVLDQSFEIGLLSEYRLMLWLGTLLIVLLATWLGRVIAQRGLEPLQQIQRQAASIGPMALDQRLDSGGFPAELQALVGELNHTFSRLEASFQRLSGLGSDIAHELRTPLQNLRGQVEGLQLRDPGPEGRGELLGEVLEELDRLGGMVEQMLFLARSDDPRTAIQREWLDGPDECARALGFFEAVAEEAGVDLTLAEGLTVQVFADRQLLQRALHNLLANAVRHSPPGGTVRLGAEPEPGGTVLWVRDSGPGIPDLLLARLGERFLRGDPSRDRTTGGSGLGLAIVDSIARLHGGSLTARNVDGGGAELSVHLPAI